MKSIGEAIQYLHSINIAHRDVKVPAVCTARPAPNAGGLEAVGVRDTVALEKVPRVVLCPRGLAPVAELAGHLSAPQALPSGQTPLRPGSLLRPCSSVTPTAPPLVCVPVVLTLSLHQCFTPTPAVSPGGAGAEGPDGVWIIGARQTVAEWGREEREESFPCRFLTAAHRFSRDTPCLSLSLAREPFILSRENSLRVGALDQE